MPEQIVIGLFPSLGNAEDVRNRLKYEGVAEDKIALKVLKPVEPRPRSLAPDRQENFLDRIFGTDLPEKYVKLVRNGETAVCVRVSSDAEYEVAANTMRQYAPLHIELVAPDEKAQLLEEERRSDTSGTTTT